MSIKIPSDPLQYSGLSSKVLKDFAGPDGFYGFGNIDSCKYLFIGPEFGGGGSSFETKARVDSWHDLDVPGHGGPCVNAPEFHWRIEEYRWFGPPNIQNAQVQRQSTYARLIELIPGVYTTKDDDATRKKKVLEYQRDKFGRVGGDDCFIDVSAIQRKHFDEINAAYHTFGIDSSEFSAKRIKKIENFIYKNPNLRLVVIYGKNTINGGDLQGMKKCKPGIIFSIDHPNAHGRKNDYWKERKAKFAKVCWPIL